MGAGNYEYPYLAILMIIHHHLFLFGSESPFVCLQLLDVVDEFVNVFG